MLSSPTVVGVFDSKPSNWIPSSFIGVFDSIPSDWIPSSFIGVFDSIPSDWIPLSSYSNSTTGLMFCSLNCESPLVILDFIVLLNNL